ncbi:YbjN domain-containing protein [Erythrobacter donghaensis]|uniref:YbjN domain-containing protein n=1 Tax=Erythrobacter donghaensis TaxID=267135 RepID=UPI001302A83A|nr:YbjN domain-containing protein [Erythrobacter donghaensis]
MRRMGILAAAALATGGLASAAQAQGSETIQVFTRADLERALTNLNATFEKQEEYRNIDITFEDSILADALLLACEDEETEKNCYGTSILATFENPEGATRETILKAINTYNYNENFGRAYLDDEDTISVRFYIISDGGITRENYETQISLWTSSLNNFFGYLYPEAATEGEAEAATDS